MGPVFICFMIFMKFFTANAANTYAVDASITQSVSSWACAKNEIFGRAIIECYVEDCSSPGGAVSSYCLSNYNNALAAGYKYIDLYAFPCTGYTSCKSPTTQVNELVNFVSSNHMVVQTIWLDFEKSSACTSNWNLGSAGNIALAKQFTNATKATGLNWGIYSSNGNWKNLFGSADAIVDSSFKVWYANFDNQDNYNDWSSGNAFGGFISPSGKQYSNGSGKCGSFDLSVFTYSTGAPQ